MTHITLGITFNVPFRIGTGRAGNMLDEVIDADRLLPGSSLKGVVREAARTLLPTNGDRDDPFVTEVFGGPRSPSPWHWDDAEFEEEPQITPRARIALDERRLTVPGALLIAEEASARHATAIVWQQRPIPADRLATHLALINISARLVEGLGADRRRGLGWVTIATDRSECRHDIDLLLNLKGADS